MRIALYDRVGPVSRPLRLHPSSRSTSRPTVATFAPARTIFTVMTCRISRKEPLLPTVATKQGSLQEVVVECGQALSHLMAAAESMAAGIEVRTKQVLPEPEQVAETAGRVRGRLGMQAGAHSFRT